MPARGSMRIDGVLAGSRRSVFPLEEAEKGRAVEHEPQLVEPLGSDLPRSCGMRGSTRHAQNLTSFTTKVNGLVKILKPGWN